MSVKLEKLRTPKGTLCIMGLGYIGLPTAAMFAKCGYKVIGVDIDIKKVEAVNKGQSHFQEPGLEWLITEVVNIGLLHAQTEPKEAETFIIAVPTPFKSDMKPDLSYIQAAIDSVLPFLKSESLIILESTSPVGTSDWLLEYILTKRPELNNAVPSGPYVAYCPERVYPGDILRELVENNRVVGGINTESANRASDLYADFVQGGILRTDAKTAELCKLAENSFRDVNIAFANELSMICDVEGIDIWELIHLANHHPRVNILQPGPGVGGHCIAVDPWFIISRNPEQAKIIETARRINDAKPEWVLQQVHSIVGPSDKIACLGVTFKADVDDVRVSPALSITTRLAEDFPDRVVVVDPMLKELPEPLASTVSLVSLEEALGVADVVIVLVGHKSFRKVMPSLLLGKKILDYKGIWRSIMQPTLA